MKKFFIQIHKITGSVMSLLFLFWCMSGIVLCFKGFPHASVQKRFENLEFFSDDDFIDIKCLSESLSEKVELEKYQQKAIYRNYKGRKTQVISDAHTLQNVSFFSKANAIEEAERFINANVVHVDSISKLDSWLPWGYYKPLLPFFKCYLDDDKHSTVYVSSKTGTVIQHTTRYARWMARFGAIPHMMYFYQIKQNSKLWQNVILVLGLIGIMVSISGIIAALFRFKKNTSGRIVGITVYKKWLYKWHHILGLFIGIFFLTFLVSGIFYVSGVPSWICAKPEGRSPQRVWNQTIKQDSVMQPQRIWNLLPEKSGLRKIAWSTAMGVPVIEAYYNNYKKPIVYVTNNDTLIPFSINQKVIEAYALQTLKNKQVSVEQQGEYGNYYKAYGMYYHPLPVYKICLNDRFNSSLYIDPQSGKAVEYFNNNKKARRILTRGLHKLDFSIFKNFSWLRITILIIISLGGLVVSFTGVLLSWKWLKRLVKSGRKISIANKGQ